MNNKRSTESLKILKTLVNIYLINSNKLKPLNNFSKFESFEQLQSYSRKLSNVGDDQLIVNRDIQQPSQQHNHEQSVSFQQTPAQQVVNDSSNIDNTNNIYNKDNNTDLNNIFVDPVEQVETKLESLPLSDVSSQLPPPTSTPKFSKVPSTRIGRLFHYGGLAAGLTFGTAQEYFRSDRQSNESLFLSEKNVDRLVDKLSTMRGAALKLGQFLSIQDSHLLPPQIEKALVGLQNKSDFMPNYQLENVLKTEFGIDWEKYFKHFDKIPIASASIGQVHFATLSDSHPLYPGMNVALKIQFPGVRDSIESDLNNLKFLVNASGILPKGLFLDSTIRVMRQELKDECDYKREAECGRIFAEILNNEPDGDFNCPVVVDDLCTTNILTTEFMSGKPLAIAYEYPQEIKDKIGSAVLKLCIREIFEFKIMQTDPNWSNFLYDESTGKINLIDFGASRSYSQEFVDAFGKLLLAAGNGNREECIQSSLRLRYLIGEENDIMINAHIASMLALGEPFRPDALNPYPFANQTITSRVKSQIPIMLKHRLTPPPKETYSLNRKLSGAFLLCSRLGSNVSCRDIWNDVTKGRFDEID